MELPGLLLILAGVFFSQAALAVVGCDIRNADEDISEAQFTLAGGEREFTFTASSSLLNRVIDLNLDGRGVPSLASIASKSTDLVWSVSSDPGENLTGSITAEYQFSHPIRGLNKICDSTGASCINISHIRSESSTRRDKTTGTIRQTQGWPSFSMDLSDVSLGGSHTGRMEVTLSYSPDLSRINSDNPGLDNLRFCLTLLNLTRS